MSIPAARNLATRTDSHLSFCLTPTHFKTHNFSPSLPSKTLLNPPKLQILRTHLPSFTNSVPLRQTNKVWSARELEQHGTVQTQESSIERSSFDSFLSVAEFLCLASSAATSIGFAVNSAFSRSHKPVFGWLGNRFLAWQCVLLVGGVVIGAVIRSRQWRRLCRGVSRSDGCSGVNLVERIEKLEEDLRSSSTIIRVLSRQLEKLGIRFRVTSKALKEPIAETAILAQKNSEATRALAAQEDILEKELCEIQKVLLAMQEQQQKQLELILAIGETGKLWESRRAPSQDRKTVDVSNSAAEGAKMMDINQIRTIARQMESSNEKL